MSQNKSELFEKIAKGWKEIEPVIVTNLAMKKPIILEGTHGICKSTLGREVSRVFGENACRCYDATKDDLVSIASVPIPEELSHGRLVFSKHDRSIWDAKVVYIDELMRANKENQNLWLEILEEHTLFGQPLQYEMVIATQNPEGYASNFELDEALLDRFASVVPIPNLQNASSSIIKDVIALNLHRKNGGKSDGLDVIALKNVVDEVRAKYQELVHNEQMRNIICSFVSEFMELLLKTENKAVKKDAGDERKLYISPRRWTTLTEAIIGMYAYRLAVNGLSDKQEKIKALEDSAYWSIYYSIATVLKIDMELLNNVFKKVKSILIEFELSEIDKLRLSILKCADDVEMVALLSERAEDVVKLLPEHEIRSQLARLLNKDKGADILGVIELCEKLNCNIFESYGVTIEMLEDKLSDYKWNRGNYSPDMLKCIDRLKTFPPDADTIKYIFKED